MLTRQAMPVEWAKVMMNLANAYNNRIRGDRAQNLEEAIAAYRQALEVLTRQAMPVEWATVMMNLANAYYYRIRGDRAQNLEEAIAAYRQALEVLTRQAMPVEWAQVMMNLANAYLPHSGRPGAEPGRGHRRLPPGAGGDDPPGHARRVGDRHDEPGDRLPDRIRGDRAQNLEEAIAAYRQALEVLTRQAMPVEWATVMLNLANAY